MKKFKILVSRVAQKQLLTLDQRLRDKIKRRIRQLSANPYRPRAKADIKKLKGSFNPELYRLRVGDFRVVYAVIGAEIRITEIIRRGKSYEWLD